MSISNLFVPNDLNLFCNSLTANTITANSLVIPRYYTSNYAPALGPQVVFNAINTPVQFPTVIASSNFPVPTVNFTTFAPPLTGWYLVSYTITYSGFPSNGQGCYQAWFVKGSAGNRYGAICVPCFEALSTTGTGPVVVNSLGTDYVTLSGCAHIFITVPDTIIVYTFQDTASIIPPSINPSAVQASIITIDYLHP
jgi:hypothetical protein